MNEEIPEIIRLPEVLKLTTWSKSTFYLRAEHGLFPKKVRLGARAVGYVKSEVKEIIDAMIASKSEEEIKHLVYEIEKRRGTVS